MTYNLCTIYCGFLILLHVYYSKGQHNDTMISSIKPLMVPLPSCGDEIMMNAVKVSYFDSNETHINMKNRTIFPKFRQQNISCGKEMWLVEYYEDDILGFTFNASLIIIHEAKLIPPEQYCVNVSADETLFLICSVPPISDAIVNIYLPCLITSTICYFGSAIIYYVILKVENEHKKCFIGYSLSMGVTFMFLIFLQTVGTGCETLGSVFFLFIFSSFIWLTCLCADLNFMIINFRGGTEVNRFYLYISLAILYPCFMLMISMLIAPAGIPDVPNSFMKNYYNENVVMCDFGDNNLLMFFIPTGVLALLSIVSLGYSCYLIVIYEKRYRNDFNWLERRSEFKYMRYECLTIILIMIVFYLLELVKSISLMNNSSLDAFHIISSLQGVFIVILFVLPYIKRESRDPLELEALRSNEMYD